MNPTDNTILGVVTGSVVLADSPKDILLPPDIRGLQFSIGAGTASAGTATLKLRPIGMSVFEFAKDIYGAAISVTISAGSQQTFEIEKGRFSAAQITLSGTGAGNTVLYSFSGI